MGLLDSLLGSFASGQSPNGNIGSTLLGLLASDSGRSVPVPSDQAGNQSPAAVSGGLNELVQRFEQSGLGDAVHSWISSGPNVDTNDLHQALGPGTVDRLSERTGLGKGQLLPLLAQVLPQIVDRLTPNNRVPNESEVSRMQQNQTVET
jgi:uncharacterized protein YidB (DUF937 family)